MDLAKLSEANISGVLTEVQPRAGSTTKLKIFFPNQKETLTVSCYPDLPFRKGDVISGRAMVGPDSVIHLMEAPLTLLPSDEANIIRCLMFGLGSGTNYGRAARLYRSLNRAVSDEREVVTYLDRLAQHWTDYGDSEIFSSLELNQEEGKKLFSWWQYERNQRRLLLLGLTPAEIRSSHRTCKDIYEKCLTNPYVLPFLSLEKCYQILRLQNKKVEEEAVRCGEIIRFVWKNNIDSAWTCTPVFFIKKKFPNLERYLPRLEREYETVVDYNSLYLSRPHTIEKELAAIITTYVKSDPINYETPIDRVTRHPCLFTVAVSEDQSKAIQGAVDHRFSIVTGSAGTGKCLGLGTKLLLHSGAIIAVENVRVGDLLMGPDSRPRQVLSLARGRDVLYRVTPSSGSSFVCNQEHLLTLRGQPPQRHGTKVTFSHQGRRYQRRFSSDEAAELFRESLREDIYDISVRDYLARAEESQLYYQGVNFPAAIFTEPFSLPLPSCYKYNLRSIRLRLLHHLIEKFGQDHSDYGECHLPSDLESDFSFLASSLGLPFILKEGYGYVAWTDRSYHFRSFTVKLLLEGDYYGFQLSGDGRFLLHDGLVTHNTTCLAQVIHNLEVRKSSYLVASFTGKAVSRIREVTKLRAPSTIHRLISLAKKGDNEGYDHLIIDEASMVTSSLFHELIRSYPSLKQITLFGDDQQLTPIEWGSLFQQLIVSRTVPVYRLTINHRCYSTSETDGIIHNSRVMIKCRSSPLPFLETTNFSFVEGDISRVYDIIQACFTSGLKASQLTVLSPYNQSLPELNKTFQSIYNLNGKSTPDSSGVKWMIGDKVMMTENDATIGVFNGEVGLVKDLDDDYLWIDFGPAGVHQFSLLRKKQEKGRKVFSPAQTVDVLTHGYALTIDKSQGSEWDFVILYIPEFHAGSFLNRNRIFTAITRAKRAIWLVISSRESFSVAAAKDPPRRYEYLAQRLQKELPKCPAFSLPDDSDMSEIEAFYQEECLDEM